MSDSSVVFTIGHSTLKTEDFLGLLCLHAITAVVDIRSTPYSRINPQYSKEAIKLALNGKGIEYVFLGKELGGRSENKIATSMARCNTAVWHKLRHFRKGLIECAKRAEVSESR